MTRLLLLSLCLLVLAPLPAAARITGQPDNWHKEQPETRDLASIRRAGVLKVLVNQSRNSSGEVKGEPIGVEYRRLRAFEQYLNSRSPSARNLTLKLIPKPRTSCLPPCSVAKATWSPRRTAAGARRPAGQPSAPVRADAAGAGGAQGNRRYTRLEQLSGRTIPLPAGSAAERHRTGQPAPGATPHGTDPDRKAGRYPGRRGCDGNGPGRHPRLHVVEQPIAERWAKVLPKLRVDRHLVLDNRADMAWYVRRDASTLRATIDRFLADYRAPADQDVAFQRVYRRAYKVRNPRRGGPQAPGSGPSTAAALRAAEQHGLAGAGGGGLESHLNPKARGSGGASGLMQITPRRRAASGSAMCTTRTATCWPPVAT